MLIHRYRQYIFMGLSFLLKKLSTWIEAYNIIIFTFIFRDIFCHIQLFNIPSASFFIYFIAFSLFYAPKTELPATKQFAPFQAATTMFSRLIPPSTCISISGSLSLQQRTLGSISAINFCPPNPGSTVMIKILSNKLFLARVSSN